jgi:hypothetical protein
MNSKRQSIDRLRKHIPIRYISGDAIRRTVHRIAITATTANRERDDIALLQHYFVLRT